jgi:hypothetical protein
MKTRITMKEFSALSFDAGIVTGGTVAATRDKQPRLTPESVGGFQPQPGDSTGEEFREMLRRRLTTPYRGASPPQRWGINE